MISGLYLFTRFYFKYYFFIMKGLPEVMTHIENGNLTNMSPFELLELAITYPINFEPGT